MSVDAQANHSQNYAQSGNHSNPSFNQSDYYYQNRSSTPPTNQESAQRTQEPRPYFYGEKNSSAKPIEVKPRSEEPEARPTEQYRSPSPRAEAPREAVRELKAPEGATEQGSPLSSDKENKTEEEREVKPDPPRVSPRPPADREALADRSRSPQEPYPTKYPTYDPRGPLRFPFTYPLERSELRPDLEAETPKPAEATQGRPLASPRENTTQHYTSTTHQHSISAHSPEGSRREKQENLRDSRKQDPEFRGTEADYRFLQQHYPPEYYSQFRRSSTGEGHHSDSDSSEARDLSRPARVSSLSPGGSSRSHTSPGSLPPTPVQGIPLLPGPLGPLGQFPQFFPENANKDLFYCHLCSYVGNSKYHFNAHMNSHFEHQCPQCDYTSRTEGRLKRHIKDFHRPDSEKAPENFSGQTKVMKREPGRPKVFKCRQCEYSSPVKTEFWDHARSHIKEDKVLCCPKCPFVTEYKHHLEYHLRNHFGSKPFKCNKCNYACVNKSMLNSHMKSHTNVYQYRCADCTYATKYCHSLKLHLRKYNHKPATVLNTDGSLPTDGSGDFDLVSKRGPPRGPRGPKEKGDKGEEMSPPHQQFSPAAANMMMTSPQAFAAQAQGMMGGFPWVMSPQGNGLAPPPPLIPVSGMPALSVQVPRTPGSVDGSKASGTSQSDLGSQHSDGDQTPPPRSGSASSHHHHHHNNQQHNKIKSALAENQDLFGAYGIPAESLMAQMGAEEAARFIEYRKQLAEAQMKDLLARSPIKPDPEAMMPPGHMAMWAHHAGAIQAGAANGHGIKREMTEEEEAEHSSPRRNSLGNNGNNGNNGDRYNDALAQDMAATIEAEARQNGECPLDLTKSHEQSQAMDLSPGNKRRYEPAPLTEEEEMRARANSMVSSISCGSLSPTPRKRSRKGKAYKLDALCLKLQERKDDSPAGNESTEEDVSDYTSDKPSSTRSAEGSVNSPSSERPRSNENVDYTAIHNSLRQLNEGVEEEESSSSHGNDVPRREVARSLEFTDTQPEQAEGKLAEKSAPLPNAPNGRYECSHCGIAFRDCILYTMHMGYHGYKDPFKCNMCGHQAANKVEFFLHIARVAHQ